MTMIYVNYPFKETKRLPFYLATEEHLALNYPKDEYFFMWQVRPTVIFGRNQLIENEVNLDYVRSHNIEYYRRKSGGGCVFADFSNIMLSFITPNFNKDFVFDNYLGKVVELLKKLGLNAEFSGRNDILVDNHKVSGNAFYKIKDRSIVHGTMLYDTDLEAMVRAITPDNEKLLTKGIASVRNRVTNLKEHLAISIEEFKDYLRLNLCESEITLFDDDLAAISRIEETYLDLDFIYGKNPDYTIIKKKKVPAGLIEVSLVLKNKLVKKINILGDYFLLGDLEQITKLLVNKTFTREAFISALKGIDIGEYIYNLTLQDFIEIVF
jgi:lipoyltransferase/lipoate-protein ligase